MRALLAALAVCFASLSAHAETGIASIYTDHATASGEHFDAHALTAAHKTLPLGTLVKITNKDNGRMVVVRINDRGPYRPGRIVDLTPVGALALGFGWAQGLAHVALDVISEPKPTSKGTEHHASRSVRHHHHVHHRHRHLRQRVVGVAKG